MFIVKLAGVLIGLAVVGGSVRLYREIEKIEAEIASEEPAQSEQDNEGIS